MQKIIKHESGLKEIEEMKIFIHKQKYVHKKFRTVQEKVKKIWKDTYKGGIS